MNCYQYFAWVLVLLLVTGCGSQNQPTVRILVQPYLQQATENSIYIQWETDVAVDGVVLWGNNTKLGESATSRWQTGFGTSVIHQVQLTDLTANTVYHYQVKIGDAVSKVYQFKTPAKQTAESPSRILAMGDMQFDSSHPTKFYSVVNDGVLPYVKNVIGKELHQGLDMVVIPGDLVDDARDYPAWRHTFFSPIAPLAASVPLYPVAGNHEFDSDNYFKFFTLPQNGTPEYIEHWYYHDLSNIRVIGLDTNENYRLDVQLEWLDKVLADTCNNEAIDFVLAQMHHPHKSELWIAGELDYSTKIVAKLERFSTDCNKPSIHFYGHTHGYSRGVSRDHNHTMVNVASAGGNLDNFGEYPQRDYSEFSVSQDEYGFVVVDVNAGEDPSFTIKRLSMGNSEQSLKHQLKDSLTVRKLNNKPQTPNLLPPQVLLPNKQERMLGCPVLTASEFSDPDHDLFGAAHWQVSEQIGDSCDGFAQPIIDRWYQHQNIWHGQDTREDKAYNRLALNTLRDGLQYCARVRYRDRALVWSDWSVPVNFTTSQGQFSENLLKNPGAEQGIAYWQSESGVIESLTNGQCDGINAYQGKKYFILGGICDVQHQLAKVYQRVDLSNFSEQIAKGEAIAKYTGLIRNWDGKDVPELTLVFRDENLVEIKTATSVNTFNNYWTLVGGVVKVPENTRFIDFVLQGTRFAGKDNDSYFDDLRLQLGFGGDVLADCM